MADDSDHPYMDPRLSLAISIALVSGSQMILKTGANQFAELSSTHDILVNVHKIVLNPLIVAGMTLSGTGAFFFILALRRLDLSYALPMVAVSYVLVVILSWLFFHEQMPPLKIVAIALIVIGAILLSIASPK